MRPHELSLDEVVAATFEAERAGAAHPPIDVLVAYHAGDQAEPEVEAVREHLSRCETCRNAVLDWSDFPNDEPEDVALRARDEELEAGWRRIAERIAPSADGIVVPFDVPMPPKARPARAPRLLLAASMTLAAIGLSFWLGGRSAAGPRANIWSVDLQPAGSDTVRSTAVELTVPDGMASVLFYLNGAKVAGQSGFEAELRTADGRSLQRWANLVPADEGNFTVALPRRDLEPGIYQLVLFGTANGHAEELAAYDLRIARPHDE